jgi:hypothetical protein
VYSIHGLDYVSHHDVLPYASSERLPIVHDLFDKFLVCNPAETKGKRSAESKSRNLFDIYCD